MSAPEVPALGLQPALPAPDSVADLAGGGRRAVVELKRPHGALEGLRCRLLRRTVASVLSVDVHPSHKQPVAAYPPVKGVSTPEDLQAQPELSGSCRPTRS